METGSDAVLKLRTPRWADVQKLALWESRHPQMNRTTVKLVGSAKLSLPTNDPLYLLEDHAGKKQKQGGW